MCECGYDVVSDGVYDWAESFVVWGAEVVVFGLVCSVCLYWLCHAVRLA